MEYNLSKIMKRAWEIKKEDNRYVFSVCLQIAWEEVKTIKKVRVFATLTTAYNYGFRENNGAILALSGETYEIKEIIKQDGFSWCPFTKEWIIMLDVVEFDFLKRICSKYHLTKNRFERDKSIKIIK